MPDRPSSKSDNTTNKRFYFNPELVRERAQRKKAEKQARQRKEKEEAFRAKEIEGKNTGYEGQTHTCPLVNESFKGSCPILSCHANITNYRRERSCCIYIESGKFDFDRWDLQEQLGIKESKVYKLKDKGEVKVQNVLLLNEILNELRSKNEYRKPKNIAETANFIRQSYLKLNEINGRHSDVELIKNNITRIKEYLKQAGKNITVSELLGLSNSDLLEG